MLHRGAEHRCRLCVALGGRKSLTRGEPHQKLSATLLAENSCRHREGRLRSGHEGRAQFNSTRGQRRSEQGLNFSLAIGLKTLAKIPAYQTLTRVLEKCLRTYIGLE